MPVGEGIEVLYAPVFGSTTQLLRNYLVVSFIDILIFLIYPVLETTHTVPCHIYDFQR